MLVRLEFVVFSLLSRFATLPTSTTTTTQSWRNGRFGVAMFVGAHEFDFIPTLPRKVRKSILWKADVEGANLDEWERGGGDAGGGVFTTGVDGVDVVARAVSFPVHSGHWSTEATIRNAFRTENGSKAVRLMRWTDRPWNETGDYFPTKAYYSTWMYFADNYNPNKYPPYDPGDGGWFNVFQFKAHDENDDSQPMFVLNVGHDDATNQMQFYLYSKYNSPTSYQQQSPPRSIPPQTWLHVEALYKVSHTGRGVIRVWKNGDLILEAKKVITSLTPDSHAIWGIGTYTNHIVGGPQDGEATIYFDDCIVSRKRVSKHV